MFSNYKILIGTKTCPQLPNTRRDNCFAGSAYDEIHSIQKGSFFLYFLKIHDKLAEKRLLKTTLYHILAILENFYTDERKTEAQFTKFWVTPDKI